jgi:hypothetical protein
MKEKLLALLIAKFAGVDNAILERLAENKTKGITDEGQLQTISDGITIATVIQSEADRRATDASQTAVVNYEKKYGVKDGKAITNPTPTPTPDDPNEPAWFKAYRQTQEQKQAALEAELNQFKVAKSAEVFNTTAKTKLKEKGIPESFVGAFNIEDESKIDEFVTTQETRFTAFKQEQINSGNWVDKPSGSGVTTSTAADAEIKAWAEKNSTVQDSK